MYNQDPSRTFVEVLPSPQVHWSYFTLQDAVWVVIVWKVAVGYCENLEGPNHIQFIGWRNRQDHDVASHLQRDMMSRYRLLNPH